MKIAVVGQPLDLIVPPVQCGSIAIGTYEVARRLAESCEVIVFSPCEWARQRQVRSDSVRYVYKWTGIDIRIMKMLKLALRLWQSSFPSYASALYFPWYCARVAIDIRREKADVVHVHNDSQFVPIIRAFNPHAKIVLHMHCDVLTYLSPEVVVRRLDEADEIITCSEFNTKKDRAGYPEFAGKFRTVLNGVDIERFHPGRPRAAAEVPRRILYVGRLSPEKGVHVLLEAFSEVARRHPAELRIIGPYHSAPAEFVRTLADQDQCTRLKEACTGSYRDYLSSLITPAIRDRVHFDDAVSHDELPMCYQEADVFVNASYTEGLSLSVLEAMACGVPVVATNVGGTPELIRDGTTGLLTPPGDPAAMAQAICRLLSHPSEGQSIGGAARRRVVERFSWDRVANDLLREYKRLLATEKACADGCGTAAITRHVADCHASCDLADRPASLHP